MRPRVLAIHVALVVQLKKSLMDHRTGGDGVGDGSVVGDGAQDVRLEGDVERAVVEQLAVQALHQYTCLAIGHFTPPVEATDAIDETHQAAHDSEQPQLISPPNQLMSLPAHGDRAQAMLSRIAIIPSEADYGEPHEGGWSPPPIRTYVWVPATDPHHGTPFACQYHACLSALFFCST